MHKSDPNTETQPELFRRSLDQNESNDNKKVVLKEGNGSALTPTATMRSMDDEDEEEKTDQLKTLLFDEGLPQGLSVTSKDMSESEVKNKVIILLFVEYFFHLKNDFLLWKASERMCGKSDKMDD